MLTANRFDEIKKSIKDYDASHVTELDLAGLGDIFAMLQELAAEIDRLRAIPQVGGRSHIKPVILDSQGQAVAPPPIAHQLQHERRAQYDADRFEAVMALPDLDPWRVFSLRWGLTPPPGGWDNRDIQLRVVHAVRLGIKDVPLMQKTISASYLTGHGIKLPPGVTLSNGQLSGVELPD